VSTTSSPTGGQGGGGNPLVSRPAAVRQSARRATPQDLLRHAEITAATSAVLPTLRNSATRWTATTTALLAVFSGVAVVSGPTDVAKVHGDVSLGLFTVQSRTLIATSVVGALVLGVISVALAGLAAQEAIVELDGTRDLGLKRAAAAETATSQLNAAKRTSLAAVALLIVAVAISWFQPAPDQQLLLVVEKGGQIACGLAVNADRGIAVVSKGQTVIVLGSDIASVRTVAACPGARG
jgi:hypothetical protein